MKTEKFKEWILLYSLGELDAERTEVLLEAIKGSEELQKELRETQELFSALDKGLPEPSEKSLSEARARLFGEVETLQTQDVKIFKLPDFRKLAIQLSKAAAILFVGFIAGYYSIKTNSGIPISLVSNKDVTGLITENIRMGNVQVEKQEDGTLLVNYEEIVTRTLKGTADDEYIQKILVHSLLNEENPGTRLQTIRAVGNKSEFKGDGEVKQALLKLVLYDDNLGVKLQSIKLLNNYVFDEEIKKTYLTVLTSDTSSAMRIEAINALSASLEKGARIDSDIQSTLQSSVSKESNPYVRVKATNLIKEYEL